jgi:hypothetical protein
MCTTQVYEYKKISSNNTQLSQAKRRFSKVAIDGSQSSMDAGDYAVAIAKKEDTCKLIALHVALAVWLIIAGTFFALL